MQPWPVAMSVAIWIIVSIPHLLLSECRPDLWAQPNITHNQTESSSAKCECARYLFSLWQIIQIPSNWSQTVPEPTDSLPQSSLWKTFFFFFFKELPLPYGNLFLSDYVMRACFQADSFLLPHVPWRSAAPIKAMCVLSLWVQLLTSECRLKTFPQNVLFFVISFWHREIMC